MIDRLIFAAFLLAVLVLLWQRGESYTPPDWDWPLLFGDYPETYDCLPEKSE